MSQDARQAGSETRKSGSLVRGLSAAALLGLATLAVALVARAKWHGSPQVSLGGTQAPVFATGTSGPALATRPTPSTVRGLPTVAASATTATVEARADAVEAQSPRDAAEGPTQSERTVYADAVFESDVADPAWARDASSRIEEGMKTVGMQGAVDCRGTLCRIEYVDRPAEAARVRVHKFVRAGTWDGSLMVTHETASDGTTTVRLYLTRPGTDVPEPDLHVDGT